MSRYKIGFIAALMVIALASTAPPNIEGGQTGPSQQRSKATTLYYYLEQLGTEYDCHFTLEASLEGDEASNWMEGYRLEPSPKKESLNLELEALSHVVPHLTYAVDKKNPQIIHITDDRILARTDYALEHIVESIDFTGTLPGLVDAIAQQKILISIAVMFISDFRPFDFVTEVHVKGENLKVRDAITYSTPLEGRGRVLWIARTKRGQLETTFIQFFGPAQKH